MRVAVRPYGSAVPLGFFAFGVGMFMYGALDAAWVKQTDAHTVGLAFLLFAAPLEGISAAFAFLARDTMAGVALGLFTGSWLLGGFVTLGAKPGVLDASDGHFLVAFTIAIALLSRRVADRQAGNLCGGDRRRPRATQFEGLADEPGVRKHL